MLHQWCFCGDFVFIWEVKLISHWYPLWWNLKGWLVWTELMAMLMCACVSVGVFVVKGKGRELVPEILRRTGRDPTVTMAGVEPPCSLDPFVAHVQIAADRPTHMQMDEDSEMSHKGELSISFLHFRWPLCSVHPCHFLLLKVEVPV